MASVAQRGAAPIAAMSDRLTASDLWPSLRGSVPARKCLPSSSRSVETASSMPALGRRSAASSPMPSTTRRVRRSTGRISRGGFSKYLRISSNSDAKRLDRLADAGDLLGADFQREFLQHAVDELVAAGTAEAPAKFDRLVQHHLERRFQSPREFVGRDQQDHALDRGKRGEAAVQIGRDLLFQRFGLQHHLRNQFVGERLVAALPALKRPGLLERFATAEFPRVKHLQRDLARTATRRRPAGLQRHFSASSSRSRAISSATRTASAPLSLRASACASVSVVSTPLDTGRPHSSATSMMPRPDSLDTTSK